MEAVGEELVELGLISIAILEVSNLHLFLPNDLKILKWLAYEVAIYLMLCSLKILNKSTFESSVYFQVWHLRFSPFEL